MSGSKARYLAELRQESAAREAQFQNELGQGRMATGVNISKKRDHGRGAATGAAIGGAAGGAAFGGYFASLRPGLKRDLHQQFKAQGWSDREMKHMKIKYSLPRGGKLVLAGAIGGGALLGSQIKKRDDRFSTKPPLKTTVSESDAKKIVGRVGLKGPLPSGLTREQKMAHYEARYVSSGGHKAQKWQRRSNEAEALRVGSVGAATGAGAGWLAAHNKKIARRVPKLKGKAEFALGVAGVGIGSGELYGAHARKKRSSYASAPAGVAASALRRMQGYTPTPN